MTQFGTNKGAPLPAKDFQSIQGYNDFNPNTNFHQLITTANRATRTASCSSPAARPCTRTRTAVGSRNQLVGGLGVSGDGVLQDDDVTSVASMAYGPPRTVKRADQVKVRGVRLPYFKYNRNPHVPLNGPKYPPQNIQPPLPAPRK